MTPVPSRLYSRAARSGPPLFFPDPDVPIRFNFDQGLAAPETFPRDDLLRLAQEILERDGAEALEYFDSQTGYEELVFGYRGLRRELARWLGGRDQRDYQPDHFILTSGSVQAIALAIQGFVDPGEVVIVEAATFPYALRYMELAGADIRSVPVDDDGMDIDALAQLLQQLDKEGKRTKLVYTIATFQLPTGAELSLPRRKQLLRLAEQYEFIVLEDNVYGSLRFAGAPLPTLLSLDTSGLVIQADAFSKTVAPGLRLGWMAGQPEAIGALASVRQDLGVSQWLSRLMAEFLHQGLMPAHLQRACENYRRKCATAVTALQEHCSEFVRFRQPNGSFYLWLEINDSVDWEQASERVARQGVFCRPGERFLGETNGRRFLRLAYSHVDETTIRDGIAALGSALRESSR